MAMKIKWAQWHKLPDGKLKSFAKLFSTRPSKELIANVDTQFKILQSSETDFFPVTINDEEWHNSFVCSPFNAYTQYSIDEAMRKIKHKIVQYPLFFIIKLMSFYLKYAAIDKNVHINNFLLSTNPYADFDITKLNHMTQFVSQQYPDHAIIFRSLNKFQHRHLFPHFQFNNYHLLGSRQVYIFDTPYDEWLTHNNNKQDSRLIKNQGLTPIDHKAMADYLPQALALYNQLYLRKYSHHNPQFTLDYFTQCHSEGIIHFQGYKDNQNKLKAFAGLFILGDTITSPLVGYDTNEDIKKGLYIHAIRLIMQYKFESRILLNLSSGASAFKRLRGGQASMEYSAVYVAHLSKKRRFAWNTIVFLSNKIGVPIIEKYGL